jgi:hypothetical protein
VVGILKRDFIKGGIILITSGLPKTAFGTLGERKHKYKKIKEK